MLSCMESQGQGTLSAAACCGFHSHHLELFGCFCTCIVRAADPPGGCDWTAPAHVHLAPICRLVDLVVSPEVLIESQGRLRLHALYYITKQIIPALDRALSLVGADVRAW